MNFEDLQYISLEGGGGKGAVYKGAIVALEKLFYKKWIGGELLMKQKDELVAATMEDRLNFSASGGDSERATNFSIMDYY
jgi:hypothetical protein